MSVLRYILALAIWLALCAAGVSIARAAKLSDCIPTSKPQYVSQAIGRHLVFVCTDKIGARVYPDGLSCAHDVCDPSKFAASMVRIITAPDYKKAIDIELGAHVKWDCDAPPNDAARSLCVERKRVIESNWDAWTTEFKPAVWRVKRNGTATTRPAYSVENGVVGTREAGRATVGALCITDKPIYAATGRDIRAEYGYPGLVTICDKQ